jgi:flagellar biosynthesis chaperone FliJ
MFQFSTGSYNIANNAQQQMQTLDQQRQKLQQQRDAALISLQSATTASDVQKYHAVIDSLNGAIAEVTNECNHGLLRNPISGTFGLGYGLAMAWA